MTKFAKQFKAAHAVSTPLVTVRTFDAKSTIDHVSSMDIRFKDKEDNSILAPVNECVGVIVWDCIVGMVGKNDKGKNSLKHGLSQAGVPSADLTADLPTALRVAGVIGEDVILFLSNAHLFWGEATVIQGVWNLRDAFKLWGSMLILLTGNGAILPAELTNDFLVLDEPLPTKEDLVAIIKDTFDFASLPVPSDTVTNEAVKALTGLPAFIAEQSTAMCLDIDAGTLDMDGLWERKRQAINQTRGLTVLQTDANLDNIGGLEQFKQYLERIMNGNNRPNVILLWDEIEKHFAGMGTDTSGTTTKMGGNILTWSNDIGMQGIIALGVPGAGKTEIVKAIANKYGVLCISVNPADMEHGIVGSSNEYLRNAQAVIDSISDKKVLSIATCNKVESLSPELKRRFANKGLFFFDAPTEIERESIWAIYKTKYKLAAQSMPDANGWTGAEIKACAMQAYDLNISLQDASKYVVPVTVSDAATIEGLRQYCSNRMLSASYPGTYVYDGQEGTLPAQESVSYTGRKMR
jgi:ATPase family protein associated with various cellular activities (AAA)